MVSGPPPMTARANRIFDPRNVAAGDFGGLTREAFLL